MTVFTDMTDCWVAGRRPSQPPARTVDLFLLQFCRLPLQGFEAQCLCAYPWKKAVSECAVFPAFPSAPLVSDVSTAPAGVSLGALRLSLRLIPWVLHTNCTPVNNMC